MASKYEIEMNFKKAKEQAERLENTADSLSDLSLRKFDETLQAVSASWKGESAALYVSKGAGLQEKMNRTASELHGIARDIRAIARRIYEAEMRNLERARRKKHS